MEQLTTTKQRDTLNTQNNVEENPTRENSTLINYEKIPGTPFTIINQEEKWFIVMGDWRITESTLTREEQIKKLEEEKWLIIMHMTIICIKKQLENPIVNEI